MVQQTALPFKYEATTTAGATAFADLPLYLELSRVVGLRKLVEQSNSTCPRAATVRAGRTPTW